MDNTLHWLGLDLRWVYSDLLAGVRRHTRCVHNANDVLHDALLRYAMTGSREGILQPHAYLRTVVGSVLVEHHREAARCVSLDITDENGGMHGAGSPHLPDAHAPSAEHLAGVRQRLHAMQRILDSLPPRCGEVFWLFRIEGHSQREIAQKLGISLNMVERHVIRALIDLRAARELLSA